MVVTLVSDATTVEMSSLTVFTLAFRVARHTLSAGATYLAVESIGSKGELVCMQPSCTRLEQCLDNEEFPEPVIGDKDGEVIVHVDAAALKPVDEIGQRIALCKPQRITTRLRSDGVGHLDDGQRVLRWTSAHPTVRWHSVPTHPQCARGACS
jgi:hypothetical protein